MHLCTCRKDEEEDTCISAHAGRMRRRIHASLHMQEG